MERYFGVRRFSAALVSCNLVLRRDENKSGGKPPHSKVSPGNLGHGLYAYISLSPNALRRLAHPAAITSLAYSDDGQHLLSGSADTTFLIWNLKE